MQARSKIPNENNIPNERGKDWGRKNPTQNKRRKYGAEQSMPARGCGSHTGKANAHEKQGLEAPTKVCTQHGC